MRNEAKHNPKDERGRGKRPGDRRPSGRSDARSQKRVPARRGRTPAPQRAEAAHDEAAASRDDLLIGKNPIREALAASRPINKVWTLVRENEGRVDAALIQLLEEIRAVGGVTMQVKRDVLDKIAGTTRHQGIVAQVAAHAYTPLDDLIALPSKNGAYPFVIVLDNINDGYNLGAVLRIADAAGIQGIILPERRSVTLDQFVAKASAGAIEHVPVARVVNLTTTLNALKEAGYWIVGTSADAEMKYSAFDWKTPVALVVGSEGEGISKKRVDHCDVLVNIPQFGSVNSLNAAVATGIVVFEALRQQTSS